MCWWAARFTRKSPSREPRSETRQKLASTSPPPTRTPPPPRTRATTAPPPPSAAAAAAPVRGTVAAAATAVAASPPRPRKRDRIIPRLRNPWANKRKELSRPLRRKRGAGRSGDGTANNGTVNNNAAPAPDQPADVGVAQAQRGVIRTPVRRSEQVTPKTPLGRSLRSMHTRAIENVTVVQN